MLDQEGRQFKRLRVHQDGNVGFLVVFVLGTFRN